MDFFTELLESYSRKHKRQLKLLETAAKIVPEVRKQRAQEIQADFNSRMGQPQLPPANVGNNSDITATGTEKGANYKSDKFSGFFSSNGITLKGSDDFSERNLRNSRSKISQLINVWFGSEEELTDEEIARKQAGEGAVAGDTIVEEGNFANDEEGNAARDAVRGIFQSIAAHLETAASKLGFKDAKEIKTFFYGKKKESLELRLAKSDKYLEYDEETGSYVFKDSVLEDSQIVGVSEVIRNMVASVNEGKCPAGEESFTDNIKKTKRGELVISPHKNASMGEALVFSDDKDQLKPIFEKAFELCGFDSMPVANIITDDIGGNSDNNIIGTGAEEMRRLGALVQTRERIKKSGREPSEKLSQMINREMRALMAKLSKLKEGTKKAFIRASESGISPEDSELLAAMRELTSGDEGRLLMAMLRQNLKEVEKDGLSLITTAGQETRGGNRQDVREYYDSDTVEETLAAAGLDPDNYDMVPVSSLIPDSMSEEEAQIAIETGLIDNLSDPVAVCKVSMKVYRNLKHITLGKGWANSHREMMQEERGAGGLHDKLIDTMLDDLGVEEEGKDEAWREMQEYNQDMLNISNTVESVPAETTVLTKDGKKIKVDSAKTYCDALEDRLMKDKDYQSLTAGEVKHIRSRILAVRKAAQGNYSIDAAYARLTQDVSVMLQHQKVQRDLQSKDPSTRRKAHRYLVAKMYHAGGSNDPKLVESAKGYLDGQRITYRRNDILRKIASQKDGWEIDTEESNFLEGNIVFRGPDHEGQTPKVGMQTTPSASRSKREERSNVNTITTLGINNAGMRSEERKPPELPTPEQQTSQTMIKAIGTLHEALCIVNKKIRFINQQ